MAGANLITARSHPVDLQDNDMLNKFYFTLVNCQSLQAYIIIPLTSFGRYCLLDPFRMLKIQK